MIKHTKMFSVLLVSLSIASTPASAESGFLDNDGDANMDPSVVYHRDCDSRRSAQVQFPYYCGQASSQENPWQDVSGGNGMAAGWNNQVATSSNNCSTSSYNWSNDGYNNGNAYSSSARNDVYSQGQVGTYGVQQQASSTLPPARFGLLAPCRVSMQNRCPVNRYWVNQH